MGGAHRLVKLWVDERRRHGILKFTDSETKNILGHRIKGELEAGHLYSAIQELLIRNAGYEQANPANIGAWIRLEIAAEENKIHRFRKEQQAQEARGGLGRIAEAMRQATTEERASNAHPARPHGQPPSGRKAMRQMKEEIT